MAYPDWRAGMKLKASLLRAMGTYRVLQGADQTRTSSTANLSSNLIIPAEANAVYQYKLLLAYSAGAGDFQAVWDVPSGATMQRHGDGMAATATGSQTAYTEGFSAQGGATTAFNIGGNTSGITQVVSFVEEGYLETASTAGNATFQFSQRVSNAEATILRAASQLYYTRIG
jgi:hypothetical protein